MLAPEVQSIIDKDQLTYKSWVRNFAQPGSFDIPYPVLRFLIPPRLYEVVPNPTELELKLIYSHPHEFVFLVADPRPGTPLDLNLVQEYSALRSRAINAHRSNPSIEVPPLPQGIDPDDLADVDIGYYREGRIRTDQRVLLNAHIVEVTQDILMCWAFGVREGFQRSRIGTSFYTQLREFGKDLRFKFLVGENSDELVRDEFFIKHLGRKRLLELSPDLQFDLVSDLGSRIDDPGDVIVDILQ